MKSLNIKFSAAIIVLSIFISHTPCVETFGATANLQSTQRTQKCKKAVIQIALFSMGFLAFAGRGLIFHSARSQIVHQEHIGYGIYWDEAKIMSLFTPAELQILNDAKNHQVEAVNLLSEKVMGDYDESLENSKNLFLKIPDPRLASSFFVGQSKSRGVCRHKVCVLSKLFDQFGIEYRVEKAYVARYKASHVWILVAKADTVSDPANDLVMTKSDFYRLLSKNGVDMNSINHDYKPPLLLRGYP